MAVIREIARTVVKPGSIAAGPGTYTVVEVDDATIMIGGEYVDRLEDRFDVYRDGKPWATGYTRTNALVYLANLLGEGITFPNSKDVCGALDGAYSEGKES